MGTRGWLVRRLDLMTGAREEVREIPGTARLPGVDHALETIPPQSPHTGWNRVIPALRLSTSLGGTRAVPGNSWTNLRSSFGSPTLTQYNPASARSASSGGSGL